VLPPLARTLWVAKGDELARYGENQFALYCNRWGKDDVEITGLKYLERFYLEGTTPVWVFAFSDALLEKRLWLEQGANTTYVQYKLLRGSETLNLSVRVLGGWRDHHGETRGADPELKIAEWQGGLKVSRNDKSFYIQSEQGEIKRDGTWIKNFYLPIEVQRGFAGRDDHALLGVANAALKVGQSWTLAFSEHWLPSVEGEAAFARRKKYEEGLIVNAGATPVPQLILAADQFIVKRGSGQTILAGYPWFGDWGRDTMISLNGLALVTKRFDVARNVLTTFAKFVSEGMLPNRFPDVGEEPEYNTVDATLWYFEAIRAYVTATNDETLLRELFPVLADIVAWHQRGTRYHIHVADDGLLYAGEAGVQLTWMDAKVGDWVVTPRIGKPIEINALWYNALCVMSEFAKRLGRDDIYAPLAEKVRESFKKFWQGGYCFDVLDTPQGNDASLRPNQLFAVSLTYSPLSDEQAQQVVDVCAKQLLTSYGLRSLATTEAIYIGRYGGDQRQRDAAYHQGTVWAWLIGPFVSAHWRVYHDASMARSFLQPLLDHLNDHGLGSLSEIFEGDEPFAPCGCIAQAWSVAEVLRVMEELEIKD
jgi:predicted glycogen debranching enzyme